MSQKRRKPAGNGNGKLRTCRILLAVLLVLTVIAGAAAAYNYSKWNTLFRPGGGSLPAELAEKSADLSERAAEQGIVLLKNQENTLPLTRLQINLLGAASDRPFYGGESGDGYVRVSPEEALKEENFLVNRELSGFYEKNRITPAGPAAGQTDFGNYEIPQTDYPDGLLDSARDYADIACLFFGRRDAAGSHYPADMEAWTGGDAGRHYLQLTQNEEDLAVLVRSSSSSIPRFPWKRTSCRMNGLTRPSGSENRADRASGHWPASCRAGSPRKENCRIPGSGIWRICRDRRPQFKRTAEGRNGTATSAQRAFTADTAIMRPDSRMPGQMIRMDWRPGRRLWHFLLDTG